VTPRPRQPVAAPARRRPGRPRDDAAEQAILTAVMELLTEDGFSKLTMGAVAERAGVGKPTVYRRWPAKAELVVDAMMRLAPPISPRRTGDPRTDLRRLVRAAITQLTSPPLGATMVALMAGMHTNPDLTRLVQERLAWPRRGTVGEAIERAVELGQLRPESDSELMLDLMLGSLLYRWLISGRTLPRTTVDRIVDTVWDAFAVRTEKA
jgi:AcrR family transcriptional regulator